MIVTTVEIYVKPAHVAEFIEATIINHEESTKEPGNMRFDVLQSQLDPTRFTLYEAYETEAAAALHKETAHYAIWRDKVAGFMAKPRVGVAHKVISPTERTRW